MQRLKINITIDIEESQIANQGIADLVVRGATQGLQQAGSLGLIKANLTGGFMEEEELEDDSDEA